MITSPDNEKLKLIRKLRQRKHRDRERLFVTEGEDPARAGLAAGVKPRALLLHPELEDGEFGEVGEQVEPELLDRVSGLGSGTRVIGIWPQAGPAATVRNDAEAEAGQLDGICIYLDGLSDPGNLGTIIRTVHALLEATVVLGPGSVDQYAPGSVRASMGSIFAQPVVRAGIETTPEPRIATVPRGGDRPGPHPGPVTVCLGAEREGLSEELLALCSGAWTVPLRDVGAESLNVAAAAAIICERISSPAAEIQTGRENG